MSLVLSLPVAAHESNSKSAAPRHGGSHSHATLVGKPGDPKRVTRSIEVEMHDTMRFSPETVRVAKGETVRFLVKNVGAIKHEMALGSPQELRDHAELMQKFPEMEHDDANAVTVEPGKTGELVWTFTEPGVVVFACLMPGHFEAGMTGMIKVTL